MLCHTETEQGDHDLCLSRSLYTDTDPTSRERAARVRTEPNCGLKKKKLPAALMCDEEYPIHLSLHVIQKPIYLVRHSEDK